MAITHSNNINHFHPIKNTRVNISPNPPSPSLNIFDIVPAQDFETSGSTRLMASINKAKLLEALINPNSNPQNISNVNEKLVIKVNDSLYVCKNEDERQKIFKKMDDYQKQIVYLENYIQANKYRHVKIEPFGAYISDSKTPEGTHPSLTILKAVYIEE